MPLAEETVFSPLYILASFVKVFNFDEVQFIYLSFVARAFSVISKKPL